MVGNQTQQFGIPYIKTTLKQFKDFNINLLCLLKDIEFMAEN